MMYSPTSSLSFSGRCSWKYTTGGMSRVTLATNSSAIFMGSLRRGPTVLADGLEKDLALVVAPSITMPCPDLHEDGPPQLPPLSNVAALASGPFTVTIPIAARYDELTRAMTMAFTDGKLFFSAEYPQLFLEKPEIYESQGAIVL